MIKITIIIPVYNKEHYLARCFDSVLNQIEDNDNRFELLVVDDGSTDSSCSVIEEYAKNNKIISYIKQKNSGVSVARNVAIAEASGDFVLFLDADDELIDGSLQKVYDFLNKNKDIDMLVTRQTRYNGFSEKLVTAPKLLEYKKYTGVEAYRNHYVRMNAGGGICRTRFIRENNIQFPPGVRNSEDTIFFGLVQVYAQSIIYYDVPLYRIFMLEGSASRVDNTNLAIRHIDTVNAVVREREKLRCSNEQKGVFEFYVFQLISNAMGKYIKSKDVGFRDMCRSIEIKKILPLHTKYMRMMKSKALLLNFSYRLYYLMNWFKIRIIRSV